VERARRMGGERRWEMEAKVGRSSVDGAAGIDSAATWAASALLAELFEGPASLLAFSSMIVVCYEG
jgi:hypothetical protein